MAPFPVDDATLDMLLAAIDPHTHGDPTAQQSSVGKFLDMMSELAGSDITAVAEQVSENVAVMRDPRYSEHDVMAGLIGEIKRLRGILTPGPLAV